MAKTYRDYLGWVALALLWGFLFNILRHYWSNHSQYAYGYIVPFMAAYLFWLRWESRPSPTEVPILRRAAIILTLVVAVVFTLARVVLEVNFDWRSLIWVLGFLALGLSWLWLAAAGGFRWVLHLGFPIAFILVAFPWPGVLETSLTQFLMTTVSSAAGLNHFKPL
jgi:hypothetical protein